MSILNKSVIITGIIHGGFMAVLFTMVMETKEIGTTYAGTAMGLILTFSRVGAFIFPPLGNSLADTNPSLPFILWAGLAALALFGFLFLKEILSHHQY